MSSEAAISNGDGEGLVLDLGGQVVNVVNEDTGNHAIHDEGGHPASKLSLE